MKSRGGRLSVLGFLFLCIFVFSSDVSAKVVLKMNHQFPAAAEGSKIDQWFMDEVKKATNGEVEIQIFWSNALGAAKENLTLLKGGAIDMAGMSPGYFPAELPFFCAPNSIPMAMDNIRQSSAIMKAFIEKVPAFVQESPAQLPILSSRRSEWRFWPQIYVWDGMSMHPIGSRPIEKERKQKKQRKRNELI